MARNDGELYLEINGQSWSGWTSVSVTRGVEHCPPEFDVEMTERFPGGGVAAFHAGDACQIKLGNDLVLTGWIDRYSPMIGKDAHIVHVRGRGKCEDLVDCSAEWPSNQISGRTTLPLAQALAAPYGITVIGEAGIAVPQFNFPIGESAWSLIEKIARNSALLAYEQPDGSLILTGIGSIRAASGFTQGLNVEQAAIEYSVDQRFNEYRMYAMSMNVAPELGAQFALGTSSDPNIRPNRKKFFVAETTMGGYATNIAKQRIQWEATRRKGRGSILRLTADSWRDEAGTLWTPNTLVPLSLPSLKIDKQSWVIAEVTHERSSRGTHARLTLMPPDAFAVEPILLAPFYPDFSRRDHD